MFYHSFKNETVILQEIASDTPSKMTEKQILLVKKSWSFFREIDPVLIGDVFYSKLFLNNPQLKNLFHSSREDQARKLIDMLSVIVGRLDNLEELNDEIRKLAERHVHYGVKESHYNAVSVALLWTLQQGLGRDWNKEIKEAWVVCFDELSAVMISASCYKNKKDDR